MYPAPIDEYVRPATVADALAAHGRYEEGDAVFIAGGQSLMQAVKARLVRPRCLIDLQAVDGLSGIDVGAGGVRIGPMTRYAEIARDERLTGACAALRDAAERVGDRQVRNRGTIGGSLCWNYVAACMPPTAIGLGAEPDRGGRHAGGDVVPAEAPADGAPVADLAVADAFCCITERGTGAGEALVAGNLRVASHGPDAHAACADIDAGEPVHRLEVDQAARAHQARLDGLHEALAAGDEDRIAFLIAAVGGECVGDRRRPHILVDRCWIHRGCSPRSPARHYRSGGRSHARLFGGPLRLRRPARAPVQRTKFLT